MNKKGLLLGALLLVVLLGLSGCLFFNSKPMASFIWIPNSPFAAAEVRFNSSSSTDSDGTITSYEWSFGDGETSILRNPTHEYADDGLYSVKLAVTDDDGATDCVTKEITVLNPGPTCDGVNFKSIGGYSCVSPYCVGDILRFSAINARHIVWGRAIKEYKWNFGDDNTGYGSIVDHSYSYPGTYTVTLTLTDNQGVSNSFTSKSFAIQECCCLPDIYISYCDDPCFDVGCPIAFCGNFGDGRCNWWCNAPELKENILEAKSLIAPESCCNPCPPCPGDPCPGGSCRNGTWEWRIWLDGDLLASECGRRCITVTPWKAGKLTVYLYYTCGGKSTYDSQSHEIGG